MPCCIERMRFSPRYSIWRKARFFLFFFFVFFDKSRTSLLQEPELGFFPLKSLRISRLGHFGGYFRPAEGPASGGSSAVEQRTVKCAVSSETRSDPLVGSSNLPLRILLLCGGGAWCATGVQLLRTDIVIRSYHGESTASHPNCEVKHR